MDREWITMCSYGNDVPLLQFKQRLEKELLQLTPFIKIDIDRSNQEKFSEKSVVVVAWGNQKPHLSELQSIFPKCKKTLVLLHKDDTLPKNTRVWLPVFEKHYHVRWHKDRDFTRVARFLTGNEIGLALSGGGTMGVGHLGIWQAMEETQLPIDMIVGVSCGAGFGSCFSMGISPYRLLASFQRQEKYLQQYTLPLISLFSSKKHDSFLKNLYCDLHIEDLWIPYVCVSTNLSSAKRFIHRRGKLWKAVKASSAIPGLMPPVVHNSQILVDGGVIENVPALTLKELCRGTIIISDLSSYQPFDCDFAKTPSPWKILKSRTKKKSFPSIADLLTRSCTINSIANHSKCRQIANFYLRPPLQKLSNQEIKSLDAVYQTSYHYAKKLFCSQQHITSKNCCEQMKVCV
ncbi:patatin-like phospholipase family protein [Candidatus Uabimicrobium sp. HlEnr_7]|uniref:patatin-like phospholipase family protein n=1 Tax=Candidatus Uabimicrobium helgolandensis TaxID=3095367 RepID=UPI00355803CE